MALVAYECSDDSNDEEEDHVEIATVTKNLSISENASEITPSTSKLSNNLPVPATVRKPSPPSEDEDDGDDDSEEIAPLSFAKLPEPNYHALSIDVSRIKHCRSKLLTKLLPVTSQSKGPVTREKSTIRICEKGSGLLSMLPNPAIEFAASPSQVSSPTTPASALPAKLLPTAVKNNAATKKAEAKKSKLNNESDDDDIGTDFFSLSKEDSVEDLPEPIDFDFTTEMDDTSLSIKPDKPTQLNSATTYLASNTVSSSADDFDEDNSESYGDSDLHSRMNLDEDAIQQLCGRKRKGQIPDDIQIIDVHEDKILAESKKNLAKQLTEETSYRPSAKKMHGPSSLERRKHQITYLAFQAKERELELKNQWANNRFTKKQTQSKYGF